MSRDPKFPNDEIVLDPGDWERIGMRQCTYPGCGRWFSYAQHNYQRCPEHAGIWTTDRHKGSDDRHKNRVNYGNPALPFWGIDGEGGGENKYGQQHYLTMFAGGMDGEGRRLFSDNRPLTTIECLEWILSLPANVILEGYGFNYDVSMILGDLPKERLERLTAENKPTGRGFSSYTYIGNGYGIDWLPKHYFRVARMQRTKNGLKPIPGTARTINEAIGFFQKPFVGALIDWGIADDQTIAWLARMKDARPKFDRMTPENLRYNEIECRYLAELMTVFRKACNEGTKELRDKLPSYPNISITPKNWRGAGYIADKLYRSTGTPKAKDLPQLAQIVEQMAREGYYGGRFEISRSGFVPGTIYELDINSAYPAALPQMPCPHTEWREVKYPEPGSVWLADITFEHPPAAVWCGLPIRTKTDHLHWPLAGSGTYYSFEIEAAKLLGAKIEYRRIMQAVKGSNCDCRPFDWVSEVYNFRHSLGKSAKGKPIKLGLNSLYGKRAQRKGARIWYDLVHAGLITAITRAKIIEGIASAPDPANIVMVATDGIYSTQPPRLSIGWELGTWERKDHPGGVFIVQPGVYFFPGDPESEVSYKTRGVSKSVVMKHADRLQAVWNDYLQSHPPLSRVNADDAPKVALPMNLFVGIKQALHRNDLTLNRRWLKPCAGGNCDHVNCGRKELSYSWGNKRTDGRIVGSFVAHYPYAGNVDVRSEPYDPNNAAHRSELEAYERDFGEMPDWTEIVER